MYALVVMIWSSSFPRTQILESCGSSNLGTAHRGSTRFCDALSLHPSSYHGTPSSSPLSFKNAPTGGVGSRHAMKFVGIENVSVPYRSNSYSHHAVKTNEVSNALPLFRLSTIRRAEHYTMSAIVRRDFRTQHGFTVRASPNRELENFARAMPRKAQRIILPAYTSIESCISLGKGRESEVYGGSLFVEYVIALKSHHHSILRKPIHV